MTQPVCRFFKKGYCRYGNSCKFLHPGENDEPLPQTGFSFTSALNSLNNSGYINNQYQHQYHQNNSQFQQPVQNTGFSFTKALQDVQQSQIGFGQPQQQLFHQNHTFDQSTLFNSIQPTQVNSFIQPHFSQQQQQQPQFGGFSFKNALLSSTIISDQSMEDCSPSIARIEHFGQQDTSINKYYSDLTDLTDKEKEIFEGDKFEFGSIPINAPARVHCF